MAIEIKGSSVSMKKLLESATKKGEHSPDNFTKSPIKLIETDEEMSFVEVAVLKKPVSKRPTEINLTPIISSSPGGH